MSINPHTRVVGAKDAFDKVAAAMRAIGGRFLIAHPLHVAAIVNEGDPHGRLDDAMEIILEKALGEFDAAIWRVLR